jgi:hypothetical protein
MLDCTHLPFTALRQTAKKLTAPLLDAYSAIININTLVKITSPSHEVEALPLYDHHPQGTHTALPITDSAHPEYSDVLAERIQELELTFVQDENDTCHLGPSLHQACTTIRQNAFHISDAAALIVIQTSVESDTASTVVDAYGHVVLA